MKLIDRYEFADGKRYETYHLELKDARRLNVPECDVLGLLSIDTGSDNAEPRILTMRPDEALIQARMLIDAVRQVSEGYAVSQPKTES